MLGSTGSVTLSTHSEGSPRNSVLFRVEFFYFLPGILLLVPWINSIVGIYPFPAVAEFVVYILLALSFVPFGLGVWQILPEEFKADVTGISYNHPFMKRHANWTEIIFIKAEMEAGSRGLPTIPTVTFVTKNWKIAAPYWKYSKEGIKALFIYSVTMAQPLGIDIRDDLKWIPPHLKLKYSRPMDKVIEYQKMIKVGKIMLLLGLIFLPFGYLHLIMFMAGAMLLFFGGMVALSGWIGIHDEKSRVKDDQQGLRSLETPKDVTVS